VKATAPQGMPIDRAAEKTSQKDIYKVDFPIKPGETTVQVGYLVPYSSGALYEGRTVGKIDEPTLLVAPAGVTLTGDGVENKGQEPQSKASIYSVHAPAYKVEIAGSMPAAPTDSEAGENGPGLEEVSPKILQRNMKWILALALGILGLGFAVLYRAQPAPAGVPSGDRQGAVKGKNERGSR